MLRWSKLWAAEVMFLVFVLMTACRPRETYRDKIEAMLEDLPTPETAVLIERRDGAEIGSEKGCVWVCTEMLYGTDESSEQIVAFYRDWMQLQGRYEEREHGSGFINAEGLTLSLNVEVTIAAHIPYSVITEAHSEFPTVYLIRVVYAPPSTWEHCSVVELPTPQ